MYTYADAKNDPSITIISICLQNIQNIGGFPKCAMFLNWKIVPKINFLLGRPFTLGSTKPCKGLSGT